MDNITPVELEELASLIADRVAERLLNRPRLLTRSELAKTVNVSVPKLDRMIRDGELPTIRVGRKVLFDPDAVIRHLTSLPRRNPAEPILKRMST